MDIRIGKVCSANPADSTVRVIFEEESLTSGWLKVLKSPPVIVPDGEKENQTEDEQGHKHKLNIKPWMLEIGDVVLCVYGSGFNSDGYVIGGL